MTEQPKDPISETEEALEGADYMISSVGCMLAVLGGVIIILLGVIAWLAWGRKH